VKRVRRRLTGRYAGILFALVAWATPTTRCLARAPWVTLQGGHYLVKRANDGDSFHVSVQGKEYIFRLYFVDAPETTSEFRDRVEEQADYFGVTVDQVLKLGEQAKAYTREKLSGPFLVRTCWEDAMGRSRMQRFYAFVQTNNGDLGEQLIENGLARIHSASAKPEALSSAAAELRKLAGLERKAKQERVGGWGANEGRMLARAQHPESEKSVDPFNKFFHPESVPPTTAPAPPEEKLDVNTASQAELENIAGIGPVIAQRIIAARPFKSADDLRNVKGIGDKKYAKIRSSFN
jgi:competence ComEA-like helix-hairpin-helix protein